MIELLHNPMFVVFFFLTLGAVVPAIAHFVYKAHRDSLEARLKEQMIQQGMSAEEIVLVLKASKSAVEAEDA